VTASGDAVAKPNPKSNQLGTRDFSERHDPQSPNSTPKFSTDKIALIVTSNLAFHSPQRRTIATCALHRRTSGTWRWVF